MFFNYVNIVNLRAIHFFAQSKSVPFRQELETEPQLLALGPYHLAVGVDKHVWFYDLGQTLGDKPKPLSERDFSQHIDEIKLNSDYCAVLTPPQLILQAIVADSPNIKDKHIMQTFPNSLPTLNDVVITCFALTQEYLIFATDVSN